MTQPDKLMSWIKRKFCRHDWQRSYADYEAGRPPICSKCYLAGNVAKIKYDVIIDGVRYVKCRTQ